MFVLLSFLLILNLYLFIGCIERLLHLKYNLFSINKVTITFFAISLVDTARLSSDSWLASNYNTFFKMAAYHIATMNEDIGKFGSDSMQQRTKRYKIYEKYLTKNLLGKFFTKTCFVASEVHV